MMEETGVEYISKPTRASLTQHPIKCGDSERRVWMGYTATQDVTWESSLAGLAVSMM